MNKILNFFKNIKFPSMKMQLKRPGRGTIIWWGVTLVLVAAAFAASRSVMRCWTVTSLPGISPASCGEGTTNVLGTPVVNAEGTTVAPPPTPAVVPEVELPSWDGASRVNILFMGVDYRDYLANQGPPRTDTMILFTIDPQSKTAGFLSIPRDLWVNVPGYGYNRINMAYPIGEGNQLPGGGAGMAMKTVEQVIGVPIQYYGMIDFNSFERVIDKLGGLYICIPEKVRIDPIGDKKPTNLKPGCQTLHGYEALAYARNRYTANGDVDRAERQQRVIYALRNQVFSPANFPTLVTQGPAIYNVVSAGVHTNLSIDDMLKLAVLLRQVPDANIKHGIIDNSMTTMVNTTLDGQAASVLKPIPDKIRVVRDDIFTTTGPTSPLATGDPVVLMQQDEARVRVLNGSGAGDLAQRTATFLGSQGMTVTEVGGAANGYQQTTVVIYSPKLYALRFIISTFGITANTQIIFAPDPASPVDLEIRLGNDWISQLPAGF